MPTTTASGATTSRAGHPASSATSAAAATSTPAQDCLIEQIDTPADWTTPAFDDASWSPATVWTEADVSPKDCYDQIAWDPAAALIRGPDLETDNTVLLRATIDG